MTAPPSPHHQRPFTDNDLCNQRQRLHSTDSYEWQFSAADARSQAEHVARLKSTLLTDAHNEFLHAAECCRHYSAESTAFAFDRFNSLKRQIEQDDRLRNSAEWQQMTAVHNRINAELTELQRDRMARQRERDHDAPARRQR